MKLVNDEETIRAIAAMLLDMQKRENTNLPLLTEQLKETQRGIDNLLNAIQQGIFTKSTNSRLEELEAAKEDLETKIANERIDTFINRICLYDDKLIITFNHKDGAETTTLNDIEPALTEQEDGSDLVSSTVPKSKKYHLVFLAFCFTTLLGLPYRAAPSFLCKIAGQAGNL